MKTTGILTSIIHHQARESGTSGVAGRRLRSCVQQSGPHGVNDKGASLHVGIRYSVPAGRPPSSALPECYHLGLSSAGVV